MTKPRITSLLAIVLCLAGTSSMPACAATTAALSSAHPDKQETIDAVLAGAHCADQAIAGVILEVEWQAVTANALLCVSQLVVHQLLKEELQPVADAGARNQISKVLAEEVSRAKKHAAASDSLLIERGVKRDYATSDEVLPNPHR